MPRRNQLTPPESAGRGRGQPSVPVTRSPPPAPSPSLAPPPATVIGSPAPVHPAASASSSSAPPPAPLTADVLSSDVEKLALQPAATVPTPSSSKAVCFPRRPGFGTVGRKIHVRANNFLVQVSDRGLHHYDVAITPKVTSKSLSRALMNQLVRMHQNNVIGNRIAYDGQKSLYTAGALPFYSQDFVVKLADDDDRKGASSSGSATKNREREFKVTIRLAARADLYHLQQFLRRQQLDCPYGTIRTLDVALRPSPTEKYNISRRSFFSPELGRTGLLGGGVGNWKGYYQSLRPTQMGLSINIDVSARSYYVSAGRRYTERLSETQVAALLRANCQRPYEREKDVRQKMRFGGEVQFWTCLNFSGRVNRDVPFQFCTELINMCTSKGMLFNREPLIPITSAQPHEIERAIVNLQKRLANMKQEGKLQLLIIILPDVRGSYAKIKRICETELGTVSQCCQPNHASSMKKQYLENVALKINVKVGGSNTVLDDAAPPVSNRPSVETSGHYYSPEDDFLKITPRKTIEELKDCREDGDYAVYAKIKGVDGGPNWFITTCKCGTEVVPQSGSRYCDKCKKHVVNVIPRYRIKARVIDALDSATFVIFEKLGCLLLHKSCTEMLKSTENDGLNRSQPLAFQQMLIDKSFIFKVEVKNSCSNELEPSYDVVDICFNDSIITQFKELNPTPFF